MNAVVDTNLLDPLYAAEERARTQGLPYRGTLTPPEAYAAWQQDSDAVLIDIRTEAELELVGRIPKAINIEWKLYPDWEPNPAFLTSIQRKFGPETTLVLICRSGVRSHEAAVKLAQSGYRNVYQVLEGFEGELDKSGQRKLNGWKFYNLPWNQS
jgi:rhodanese-related sulfurtransferase